MWHDLTSDQELLRDTTARYLSDRVPLSKQRKLRDHPAGFEPDYWTGGAELGWTMLLASEDEGGGSVSGRGLVDLATDRLRIRQARRARAAGGLQRRGAWRCPGRRARCSRRRWARC